MSCIATVATEPCTYSAQGLTMRLTSGTARHVSWTSRMTRTCLAWHLLFKDALDGNRTAAAISRAVDVTTMQYGLVCGKKFQGDLTWISTFRSMMRERPSKGPKSNVENFSAGRKGSLWRIVMAHQTVFAASPELALDENLHQIRSHKMSYVHGTPSTRLESLRMRQQL